MSDIAVHLVCGKHTRSIKVSIDNRCKVVNFERNYPELKHKIWWKGLFISDVYILCDSFVVNLRKNNSLLQQSTSINADFLIKNVANKDCIIFENGEALSREQIEEIKMLLISYSNQKVTSIELDLHVLKLLYCYILPSFVFMRTDLDWLHWCLKFVRNELQKIDAELIKDDKHLVKFATKLREKRVAFRNLPEVQKENVLETSNDNFLNTIISHFQEDCHSLEENYNKCRARVQNLKEHLKESMAQVEEEESKVERDLYFEREESHRIWEEMVALKINIANMEYIKVDTHVSRKKKNVKDALSLPHNYMELHELREGLKKKVKDSCLDKLHLKSIVETIKMAIGEVETFGDSLAMESVNKEDSKSVDEMNELGSTCWKNCAEKMKCLLRDPNQHLSQVHFSFKDELHLKISYHMSEQSLFQESSVDELNPKCNSDFLSSMKSQVSIKELDILNPFADVWVGIIDQLKNRIHEQITKMSQMIMSSTFIFEKSEQKQIPKIYENILISEIINDLYKLFEMALESYCKEMYSRISSLSYSDLISNMVFSNNEKQNSDQNDFQNSVLPQRKKSIFQASFKIPLCKSKSLPGFSKDMSRISISFPLNGKGFQDWEASNRSSFRDSVTSALLKGSVSSLYKEADIEYKVLCKERTESVILPEVNPSSNTLPSKNKQQSISLVNLEEFLNSFHPSILIIQKFFSLNTLDGKLSCMVRILKCISYSIINIENRLVTVDDLIGILSVLIFSLSEEQLKRLCWELVLINTFMPQDEQMSISGNALVHFLCAFEALYRQTEKK